MPKVDYIEPNALPPRRHTRGDAYEDRRAAREHLQEAIRAGKALKLILGADERDINVKHHYAAAAREMGLRVRFQTLERRDRQTRTGRGSSEACELAVLIGAAETAEQRR